MWAAPSLSVSSSAAVVVPVAIPVAWAAQMSPCWSASWVAAGLVWSVRCRVRAVSAMFLASPGARRRRRCSHAWVDEVPTVLPVGQPGAPQAALQRCLGGTVAVGRAG